MPFVFVLLFLSVGSVLGQAPPLVLTDTVDRPVTAEYIELLGDPAGALGFADVSSPELGWRFKSAGRGIPHLGFTRKTIWARVRIQNDTGSAQALLLKVDDPRLAFVDYWARTGLQSTVIHKQNGRFQDLAKRDLSHRSFLFDLPLDADDTAEIMLRIRSYAGLNLPLRLTTHEQVDAEGRWEYLGLGIFFGALLIMFGYNLVLFGFLRDPSYLFLCLFIFFGTLWRFDFDGLLTTVSPGLWPVEWPGMLIGASLACASLCLFTRAFLDTRRSAVELDRVLLVLAGIGCLLPLLHWADPDLASLSLSVYALIVCFSAFSVGLLFWFRGDRLARYFLLAWLLMLATISILALSNIGLFPSGSLIRAGPYAGALMMVLLLSLAQADRINVLRAGVDRANLDLRQNEAQLAALVHERTIELIYARDLAESASRAKSEFLASVSHELRTPMNAVLGFASLLRQQGLSARGQGYLDNIEGAGRALLTLINDVLDLSKIESGKLELRTGPVHLCAIAAELSRIFAGPAAEKGLRLSASVEQGGPGWILADEARLRQILVNLTGNAVKYTAVGRVDLHISARSGNDGRFRVSFAVADTGPGIPAALHKAVFEPFNQGNAWIDAEAGGVGLGLSICTRLAGLMGGEIRLQSEEGVGSTFTLVLLDVARAEPPPPARDPATGGQPIAFAAARILITDDDPSNRLLLVEYLRPLGFELIQAETGAQAIKLAKSGRPDLILMDIGLPDIDGIAVTQALKSEPRTALIPVIAVTAAVIGPRAREAASVCDGYLTKPVSKAALLAALSVHLKHDATTSPSLEEPAESAPVRAPEPGRGELPLSADLRHRIDTLGLPYCSIDDIEALAGEILAEGQESGDRGLIDLAEALLSAARRFDTPSAVAALQDAGLYKGRLTRSREAAKEARIPEPTGTDEIVKGSPNPRNRKSTTESTESTERTGKKTSRFS